MTDRCPKCKSGDVKVEENYGGRIFKRKKKIVHYCIYCDWENTKTFDLNEAEYQSKVNKDGDYF